MRSPCPDVGDAFQNRKLLIAIFQLSSLELGDAVTPDSSKNIVIMMVCTSSGNIHDDDSGKIQGPLTSVAHASGSIRLRIPGGRAAFCCSAMGRAADVVHPSPNRCPSGGRSLGA